MLDSLLKNTKTVKDLVENVKPDQIAIEWEKRLSFCHDAPLSDKGRKNMVSDIANFQKTLSAIPADEKDKGYVMLAARLWDDEDSSYTSSYYKKEGLEALTQRALSVDIPEKIEEDQPAEYYEKICDTWYGKTNENQITSYGYEFSEWGEVLSTPVIMPNLRRVPYVEFVADILWEMSFCGYTREDQEKAVQRLDKAMEESRKISELPEEERKKHTHTLNELYEECGWERPSEEERAAMQLAMRKDCAKNVCWLVHELRLIAKDAEEAEASAG